MIVFETKDHIKTNSGIDFNICDNFPLYHGHTFWEFIYVFSPATHLLNGVVYKLPANNIIVIKPGDFHSFTDCKSKIGQMNIKITDEKLKELCSSLGEDAYKFLKSYSAERLSFHTNHNFGQMLRTICDTLLTNPVNPIKNATMYKLYICYIIEYLYRHAYFSQDLTNLPEEVKKMHKELTSPTNFNLPLAKIIEKCNYSYSQATRLLKQHLGQMPKEIFTSAKMQYACNQLISNNCKIVEVAQITGYSSQAHFDLAFKSYFKISPKEYRKQNKN